MRKIATALASAALLATLAAPAGAAVISQPGPTFSHEYQQPPECYGYPHHYGSHWHDGCTDEREPQPEA